MSQLQRYIDEYPNLTATQQQQLRRQLFERLTDMQLQLKSIHDRGDIVMAELQTYIAFVTANVADFNADGTTADATTARDNLDDEIISYANGQTRISGATR